MAGSSSEFAPERTGRGRASRLFASLAAAALGVLASGVLAAQQLEITIPTSLGDTDETFWLQIPEGYDPAEPRPLLIGWHQLSANHDEMRLATVFDSVADARGWIAASHDGPIPAHWTNHAAQSHVVDVIRWIEAHYAVDPDRIYMVGSSMGGAAGMIFANNHLDPSGPMIAAAASISGIQDCERRFHEQGINYSMIAAFGGTPEEVPFEYHRNSAICFSDSTASMHVNARHLPLWLTFGQGETDQPWRTHAEDLFAVLDGYADSVVLRESAFSGHGWGCAEAGLICDFLAAFRVDRHPRRISVQADEDGAWYWARLVRRGLPGTFGRVEGEVDAADRRIDFAMLRNIAWAAVDPAPLGLAPDAGVFRARWAVLDSLPAELVIVDVSDPPALILRDGLPFAAWRHDPVRRTLTLTGEGTAEYTVFPQSAALPEGPPPPPPPGRQQAAARLTVWPNPFRGEVWFGPASVAPAPSRLLVFDLSGRLLAEIGAVAGDAGAVAGAVAGAPIPNVGNAAGRIAPLWRWDGRDRWGRPVPAGRYLVTDPAGLWRSCATRIR